MFDESIGDALTRTILLIHKKIPFLSRWINFFCINMIFLGNFVVEALVKIKNALNDPRGALNNWDEDSVDPCSWAMITCSSDNLVTGL